MTSLLPTSGCGSGIWQALFRMALLPVVADLTYFIILFRTLSMANKFPHVEVIGIDLAPAIMNEGDVRSNCRFELDDINQGLPRFHGQVDLVHMRSVSAGVSPSPSLIPKTFPVKPLVLFYHTFSNII